VKSVKRQHYVPRFYLKRFTVDDKRLYIYDKFKCEVRGPESIENVAQERYFYDLPPDTIPPDADVNQDLQLEEKALASLESDFNTAIDAALRVANGGEADLNERLRMAQFVTMQVLRTRAFRNQLVEDMTKLQEATLETLLKLVAPTIATEFRATVTYNKNSASMLHAKFMWDVDLIAKIAAGLYHHLWFIGVNKTDVPLYTSDNPVVLRSHKLDASTSIDANAGPGLTLASIELQSKVPGLLSEGVEIVFPLAPTCALFMLERTFFAQMEPNQGRAFSMTIDAVQQCNAQQVLQSERQVYSTSNDFSLARSICGVHPEGCNPQIDSAKLKSLDVL